MSLLPAMSVPSQFVVLVMNMSEKMVTSLVPSARLDTRGTRVRICVYAISVSCFNPLILFIKWRWFCISGSPRVEGDDDEDDVDDLENEFDYAPGNTRSRRQWEGEDADLSSSSRHESLQPIPLLTNGQPVVFKILCLLTYFLQLAFH